MWGVLSVKITLWFCSKNVKLSKCLDVYPVEVDVQVVDKLVKVSSNDSCVLFFSETELK